MRSHLNAGLVESIPKLMWSWATLYSLGLRFLLTFVLSSLACDLSVVSSQHGGLLLQSQNAKSFHKTDKICSVDHARDDIRSTTFAMFYMIEPSTDLTFTQE